MEKKEIVRDLMPARVWFIDANVGAHWIMGKGGVLRLLIDKYRLSTEFHEIYLNRYQHSISFIDRIKEKKSNGLNDEFFLSALSINELFKAVRDEFQSVLLFTKGIPMSRWSMKRNSPNIEETDYNDIYGTILDSIDKLFQDEYIEPIDEVSHIDEEKNYFDIYSSLLFLIKQMETQDAILLTTAIFEEADYFVTMDESLRKNAKKRLEEKYGLNIVHPRHALTLIG